jgi:hypothetical protein
MCNGTLSGDILASLIEKVWMLKLNGRSVSAVD